MNDTPPPQEGQSPNPLSESGNGQERLPTLAWWRSSRFREVVETLCLAVLIFISVRVVVLNFRVDGMSMESNLHDGQMLLVNRNAYASIDPWALVDWIPGIAHDPTSVHVFSPPQRGDIVVLNPPVEDASTPYIKRIIGLEGETVELRDDGVYINGNLLLEPYIDPTVSMCASQPSCGPFTVPEDHVFVLGDNRLNSRDSPDFGSVPVDDIIGKAWLIYWPLESAGTIPNEDYSSSDPMP